MSVWEWIICSKGAYLAATKVMRSIGIPDECPFAGISHRASIHERLEVPIE